MLQRNIKRLVAHFVPPYSRPRAGTDYQGRLTSAAGSVPGSRQHPKSELLRPAGRARAPPGCVVRSSGLFRFTFDALAIEEKSIRRMHQFDGARANCQTPLPATRPVEGRRIRFPQPVP